MTFEEVLVWCRANRADVRGVYRGKDISISHANQNLPNDLPSLGEIFHWDLEAGRSASSGERFGYGTAGERQDDAGRVKSTIRGRE